MSRYFQMSWHRVHQVTSVRQTLTLIITKDYDRKHVPINKHTEKAGIFSFQH